MPARDLFHQAVKNALEKDGWTITADPLVIQVGGIQLYIDLAAEKVVAAEKDGRRIAVEIKSFLGPSNIDAFHSTLGQFLNYRLALEIQEPQRNLYLAVPADVYNEFFSLPFIQEVVRVHMLRLIVYATETEALTQWIN